MCTHFTLSETDQLDGAIQVHFPSVQVHLSDIVLPVMVIGQLLLHQQTKQGL